LIAWRFPMGRSLPLALLRHGPQCGMVIGGI
jgi:hypothetical protein